MSKRSIVAMGLIAMAVALGSSNAWALEIRTACSSAGQNFPTSGPSVSFHGVQTTQGHWTNSTTLKIDSGSLTVNAQGIVCSYSVDTTASSASVFNSDGTGTTTIAWTPASGNPTSCEGAFSAHSAFTSTGASSYIFVETDPDETAGGSCVNSL